MKVEADLHEIAALLGDALAQASRLFQAEIDLAKTEMSEKVARIGGGLGLLAAAALLIIPAVTILLFALAAAFISLGWAPSIAYLVTGILAAVLGAILAGIGVNRLSLRGLSPTETLTQLERDKGVVKGLSQ